MSESGGEPEGSAEVHVGDAPDDAVEGEGYAADGAAPAARKRRRGSRGGRNRKRPAANQPASDAESDDMPKPPREGRLVEPAAADAALVRRPQIGDTRPAPKIGDTRPAPKIGDTRPAPEPRRSADGGGSKRGRGRSRRGRGKGRSAPAEVKTDAELIERRRGKERNGRAVGRYLMCVQVRDDVTQVAVLEGRSLLEHYVSRPADDETEIHGNIYLGKVQNVLAGMEAAFVDIGTAKNAVLYRGDVQFEREDVVEQGPNPRIEQVLRARQQIMCQVTKNPIGAKGGRLTQEVSLPGRFVVLVPDTRTYGISKRLPDGERRRLRGILDRIKPEEHGIIVRTAAENATEEELTTDLTRLLETWAAIRERSNQSSAPALLHREPPLAVRIIREEFSSEYRGILIDDRVLYEEIRDYVGAFNPELVERVEFYDSEAEGLPLFEAHRVHEQLRKALDKKVWLPSGGSLIIEHTEALTVIDVNTGKNVGRSSLEETVFLNNLEAAEEIARQLRLRDIGGIIVIDFIDMEVKDNRRKVVETLKGALSRDKTRTQVFEISELGLVEMTRKRIGEGLITSFADPCGSCDGRGVVLDLGMLD